MSLSTADTQRLELFLNTINERADHFLGYPVSRDFDYGCLLNFLSYPLNNLGDPFSEGTWKVDSRQYEQEVVTFMAGLFRGDPADCWGYVTNGGSEGNLYGLYLAREMFPRGIVYYSCDTHYSVKKNLHLLQMEHIMIRSQPNGEIDYHDLRETIRHNRSRPAIIFANIGTTMTEAKDDLHRIREILDDFAIAERYIHSDAALCGGLAPFISPRIAFDFADGADSIAVSGHKSFGSPIPCGVLVTKKSHVTRVARSISYIGSLDTTISGSRNGLTPLFLWYAIKSMGAEGMAMRVRQSLAMAEYAEMRLREIGISAWRNPQAITVVFPEVDATLREKYQLATTGGITHLVLMPHINRALIDAFIRDIERIRQ